MKIKVHLTDNKPTVLDTNAAMAADTRVFAKAVRIGTEEDLKEALRIATAAVAILQHEVVRLTQIIEPNNVSAYVEH